MLCTQAMALCSGRPVITIIVLVRLTWHLSRLQSTSWWVSNACCRSGRCPQPACSSSSTPAANELQSPTSVHHGRVLAGQVYVAAIDSHKGVRRKILTCDHCTPLEGVVVHNGNLWVADDCR